MRVITSSDEQKDFLESLIAAQMVANGSTCLRSKCGSIIIDQNNIIIGQGYNSPPLNAACSECRKDSLPKDFKSDKTCCMHAEQRAVMSALKFRPETLVGSTIFFVRLDEKGDIKPSGEPYCTICSKMCLDAGISKFVLWKEKEGICIYDTHEYNELSFKFSEK